MISQNIHQMQDTVMFVATDLDHQICLMRQIRKEIQFCKKKKRVHTQPIGLIFKIYALSAFNNLITILVNQDQTCWLAVGYKEIIVATGTILEYSKPNILVVIDMVLAPVANLSIQTSELFYVTDGLKQYILWS